eukprot:COSAG06_NODE_1000_length_11145_cov_9.091526_10_plen_44_part_01
MIFAAALHIYIYILVVDLLAAEILRGRHRNSISGRKLSCMGKRY